MTDLDTLQIQLTTSARDKLQDLLLEENDPAKCLRIYVQGGGCAGFSYGFMLDTEQSDDYKISYDNITVLVDAASGQYLAGSTVDYVEQLFNNRFVIDNPNATVSCGCGSSFAV